MEDDRTVIYGVYDEENSLKINYDPALEHRVSVNPYPEKRITEDEYIMPAKLQIAGTCWIFGVTSAIETYLLSNKIITKSSDYSNLSELHIMYDMFDIGKQKTEPVTTNSDGKTPTPNPKVKGRFEYGGCYTDIVAYLARNPGLVCDTSDPWLSSKMNPNYLKDRARDDTLKKERMYKITGIKLLNGRPNGITPPYTQLITDMKDAVMRYGSIAFSYYKAAMFEKKDAAGLISYYSLPLDNMPDNADGGSHNVSIFGWDDNYDKAKFASCTGKDKTVYTVKSNGGFWAKDNNPEYSDKGFFWISYEDYNLGDGLAITAVDEDSDKAPLKVNGKARFCMTAKMDADMIGTKYEDDFIDKNVVTFSSDFRTTESNEKLTAIGLFCVSPCVADVTVKIGTGTEQTVISGEPLYDAGYRVVNLSTSLDLGAAGTFYTVKVTYAGMNYSQVFAPLELKDGAHQNVVLDDSSTINGVKVKDINTAIGGIYGNVGILTHTTCSSDEINVIQEAYNNITAPVINGCIIKKQPDSYNGTGWIANLDWRIEPYDGMDYLPDDYKKQPNCNKDIKTIRCGNTDQGRINTSLTNDFTGYITCAIGDFDATSSGGFGKCKKFPVKLTKWSSGSLTVNNGKVSDTFTVDFSGEGQIPYSTVTVSAPDQNPRSVYADKDGKWSVTAYPLINKKYVFKSEKDWLFPKVSGFNLFPILT
jgi:hypothetical protein